MMQLYNATCLWKIQQRYLIADALQELQSELCKQAIALEICYSFSFFKSMVIFFLCTCSK